MIPTRRFWTTGGLAVVLAGLAVVFDAPSLLLGTAAIAGLLLHRAWVFLRTTRRTDRSLSVTLDLPRTYVRTGEETPVTFTASLERTAPIPVTVTVEPPLLAGSEGVDLSVTIPADEDDATVTSRLSWPTAGTAGFEQPTVSLESGDGLFRQTLPRGPTPSVVVEPRAPRNVHVGEGGDRSAGAFGAHRSGQLGVGIDPAELREYVHGDDVGDIDWKATARTGEPYVREYEVETDRRTVLVFDHREAMAVGPPGESKLAYLRELALAVAWAAESAGDPLGLYGVGDGGLTAGFAPGTEADHYRAIRERLHDFETTTTGTPELESRDRAETGDPATARRKIADLAGDESAFATQLRPYLADGSRYLRRIEGEPLYDVTRTFVDRVQGQAMTMLFTDDTDRAQVREAVKAARSGARDVVVFLTPRALFEEGSMTDLEGAYERYAEFEAFRRDLASIDRVSAYEVAPGDRVEAVLAAGRSR